MPLTRHPPAPQRSSKAGSTLGTACRALPAAASVHRRGRSAPRAPPVVLARAVGDGGAAGGDADKPDIDQLASMLSQQAAKMRASMGSMDEPLVVEEEPPEEQSAAAARMMPEGGVFASLSPGAAAALLEDVGPGGFIPEDLQLLQELGRMSVQQVSTSGSNMGGQQAAVVAWAASYRTGMPYQNPVNVLVKEYLNGPYQAVACNELWVMQRLYKMPSGNKWQAATQIDGASSPPVVPLLGYFLSPPSDAVYELTGSNEESLWLVYKWEGLRPASMLLELGPPQPPGGLMGLLKGKEAAQEAAWAGRRRFLRTVARGVLAALAYCHERGVAHCSLSPGSVLLTSCSDADAGSLIVRLSNFGFGRLLQPQPGSPLQLQGPPGSADAAALRKQDLQAAALLLAELLSAGLATQAGGAGWLDPSTLQRLLFDVFHEDIAQFKAYCQEDEALQRFVELMDDDSGAGWELLAALMVGEAPAHELLECRFCSVNVA